MVWKYLFDDRGAFLNAALEKTSHRPIEQGCSRAPPQFRMGHEPNYPAAHKKVIKTLPLLP